MKVFSSLNIRKIEQNANDLGISYLTMMENAGEGAVKEILKRTQVVGKTVVIIAGGGNNGGDGYAVARLLENEGALVRLLKTDDPVTDTAKEMASRFKGLVIDVGDSSSYEVDILEADIIIDAIFGIGLTRDLSDKYLRIIEKINCSDAFKVSLDIPSGVFADSNKEKIAVKADLTTTFIARKPSSVLYPAALNYGECVTVDIDIPYSAFFGVEEIGEIVPPPFFTKRNPNTHKGSYGTLSLICGSFGMAGAAILSTKAGLRSGVGIARVTLPKNIYPIVAQSAPEAVYNVYNENHTEGEIIEKATLGAKAVVIGCGISTSKFSEKLVKKVLENYKGKLIIDADGLNVISSDIECIKRSGADIILTPHPAEMARLCGVCVEDIENDRIGFAKKLSKTLGCTVVLKGSITVVSGKGKIYFNTTGNAGMATGGSGDVLAGIMGGMACLFEDAINIAVSSVYVHGMAGDMASEKYGEISALPTDTIFFLPEVYKTLGEI